MIIVAKKLRPLRLAVGLALFVLVCGVLGGGLGLVQDIQKAQAVASLQVDPRGIHSNQERVDYLESYGWIVSPEAVSVEEIHLPDSFDDSYSDYLALQKEQGFDLTRYAGKTIQRFTYQVTNYPGLRENIWACLLLYRKEVIGGEVYCSQGDGFQQGLTYPAQTK